MIYDVHCPRCDRHARAAMVADGLAGTYRELRRHYRVERITCTACGLISDVSAADGQDFAFWYKVTIGGQSLWASNLARR